MSQDNRPRANLRSPQDRGETANIPRVEFHPAPDEFAASSSSSTSPHLPSQRRQAGLSLPTAPVSPGSSSSRLEGSLHSSSLSLNDLMAGWEGRSAASSTEDVHAAVLYEQGRGTPDPVERLLPPASSMRSSRDSLLGDGGPNLSDEDLLNLRPLSPWRPFRERDLAVPLPDVPVQVAAEIPHAEPSPPQSSSRPRGTVQVVDFNSFRSDLDFSPLPLPQRGVDLSPTVPPPGAFDDDLFAELDEQPDLSEVRPPVDDRRPGWRPEQSTQTFKLKQRLMDEAAIGGERVDATGRKLDQEEVRQVAGRQLAALEAPLAPSSRAASIQQGPQPWAMDAGQRALYDQVMAATSGRNVARAKGAESSDLDSLVPGALGLYRVCLEEKSYNQAGILAGMLLLPRMGTDPRTAHQGEALMAEMDRLRPRLGLGARVVLDLGGASFLAARQRHAEAAAKCREFDSADILVRNSDEVAKASGVAFVPKMDHKLLVHATGVRLALGYGVAKPSQGGQVTMLPQQKRLALQATLDALKAMDPSPSRIAARPVAATTPLPGSSKAAEPAVPPHREGGTPLPWKMTPGQQALYGRVQSLAQGRGLQQLLSAGPAPVDELLREAYTLCANRYQVGDFDKAATLAGLLLLPRMGAVGPVKPAQAMGEKIAEVSDRLSPEARVIFRLGHAAYLASRGRPDGAAALCAQHANAQVLDGLSDVNVLIHALRTRLALGHGLDDTSRLQVQLRLAKNLCLTGRLDEARLLVGQSARDVLDRDLARESLWCIEVEADAAQVEANAARVAPDMQRAAVHRAVKLYGIYLRRQEELRDRLVQEALSERQDPGHPLAPAQVAALTREIESELTWETQSVRDRLATFKGRIPRLAYQANVASGSNGDEELATWARQSDPRSRQT